MNQFRLVVGGTVLLMSTLLGLSLIYAAPMSMARGMMMGPEGMKSMMQRMMGDVLPPGIDPALLPEP